MDGHTRLYAPIGYPTGSFKAPLIYKPWFEDRGINAAVVPMGVRAEDLEVAFPAIFRFSNVDGALITMPHKASVIPMLDEVSVAVQVAGACNAVRKAADGRLIGSLFDGYGFSRALGTMGFLYKAASARWGGGVGVGSAIAAALAGAGVGRLVLSDSRAGAAEALAGRLRRHFPVLDVAAGGNDPAGFDLAVNATPLGMAAGDPLPFDPGRLAPETFVGEVVMTSEITPLLAAAQARGCRVQVGVDMLFEQIPAYLEFFGFPTTDAATLRGLARLRY